MATCPSCGKELPGAFPFCPFCAAPLTEQPAAPLVRERKVVSVLFCDLVGFTAASEALDPEDVQARLQPYHQRLREVIERFGGTVEKFVGDAVLRNSCRSIVVVAVARELAGHCWALATMD